MMSNMSTTSTPVHADRFEDFIPADLLLMHELLCAHAGRVTEDAERGKIREDERADAAASFLRACTLAYEIGDVLGDCPPPLEDATTMAAAIESGGYRELAQRARDDAAAPKAA
jgi:hypothetical protein